MKKLLEEYQSVSLATDGELATAEANLGRGLPTDYKDFLRKTGAGEGFVGDNYVIIWQASELDQFNREYEVQKYVPSLYLFGSNGGGEGFYFDLSSDDLKIGIVPFIGMSLEDAKNIACSFTEFLEKLHESDGNLF